MLPRRSMRFSLKSKIAFFTTLLVVFVAASLSYYIRYGQKLAIVESQERNRLGLLQSIKQAAREALMVDDDTIMVNFVNLLQKEATVAYAMVLHPDGRIRVHTDPTQLGKVLTDEASRKALGNQTRNTPLEQHLTVNGKEILDLSIPSIIGADNEFNGIARIGFDKRRIDENISESLREVDGRILSASLVAIGLGWLGALALAAFITNPIRKLRAGARTIGEGRLDHRIDVRTGDELEELADEFNIMGEKLTELDRMKQDFVSNVTHELRSPMTSVRGYIDLLLKGAAGNLNDLQKDYLSVVKNSSVRLGRFIDNLLDVAKIEAQKLKLTPEEQSVFELAHEMSVLFKPQLDEKKLKIVNAIPNNGTRAFVDRDKIAEVFINLTSNAIKFTPEGGDIRISSSDAPTYIEVCLEDSGVGIPPDMIGKLFNKFEQVKAKKGSMTAQRGTGLGLAIVKGIIEAHGGKIWIKSPGPSGKGTAFYFTIPRLTPELKAKLDAE